MPQVGRRPVAGPGPGRAPSPQPVRRELQGQNLRGNAAIQDRLRGAGGLLGQNRGQAGGQTGQAQAGGTQTVATDTQTAQATGTQLNETALTTLSAAAVAVAPEDMRTYAESAIPGILRQAAMSGVRNLNQVAYILATAQHESRFGKPLYSRSESLVEDRNPFSQRRNGTWAATEHVHDRQVTAASADALETEYWDSAYGGRLGNEKGTTDGRDFRGRGYVQLTGRENYRNMSAHLNEVGFSYSIDDVTYGGQGNPAIDLTAHPDHVNRVPELAARIMVDGMKDGTFTGSAMSDHINDEETDFTNARSVVNGDTSTNGATIAEIARGYAGALATWSTVFQVTPAA